MLKSLQILSFYDELKVENSEEERRRVCGLGMNIYQVNRRRPLQPNNLRGHLEEYWKPVGVSPFQFRVHPFCGRFYNCVGSGCLRVIIRNPHMIAGSSPRYRSESPNQAQHPSLTCTLEVGGREHNTRLGCVKYFGLQEIFGRPIEITSPSVLYSHSHSQMYRFWPDWWGSDDTRNAPRWPCNHWSPAKLCHTRER